MSFLERICRNEKDAETATNSSALYINQCFENRILTWPIATFVLTATIFQIYVLIHSFNRSKLKRTWKLLVKLAISISLLALAGANLSLEIIRTSHVDLSPDLLPILAALFLWLCMLDHLILTEWNHRRGHRSTGIVFIARFLLAICGILPFIAIIANVAHGTAMNADNLSYYQNIFHIFIFSHYLAKLILNCFANDYTQGNVSESQAWPECAASLPSKITFAWVIKLAIKCYNQSLSQDDLWKLKREDTPEFVVPCWEAHWNAALENQRRKSQAPPSSLSMTDETIKYKPIKQLHIPSLLWNLLKTVKWNLITALTMGLAADALSFANPIMLKTFLAFIDDTSTPMWTGVLFAFILLLCNTIYAILLNRATYLLFNVAMHIRTALTSTLYKKALRLRTGTGKGSTIGELVNLMAEDIQPICDCTEWIYIFGSTALIVIVGLYLLYQELGYSALAGFGVMLLLMPVNLLLGKFQRKRRMQIMKFKDQRMKLMNEIVSGIKALKMYAWEHHFEKKVLDERRKEISILRLQSYFAAANVFITSCAPFMLAVISFATFVLSSSDHVLTAQKAFVSLALFGMMRQSINTLPMCISGLVEASVSNKRLKEFLAEPELNPDLVVKNGTQEEAVLIQHGTFAWREQDEKATLTDINLAVNPGQLVAIVGPVGCGKSSLLSAILGDMEPRGGVVYVKGSTAYVPQQAWIQSLNVRNNIIFMRPYIKNIYNSVVDACALRQDFDILPDSDMTEIGGRGINLSGGQKQRVSLARAIYQNRDIYLMDDPLSAVDAHVGRHIFDKVIGNQGLLKNKTRILVTHGLAYLEHMDNIFVMKDGKISDSGTLRELIHKKGPFAEFLETYFIQKCQDAAANTEKFMVNEIVEELQNIDPIMVQRLKSISSSASLTSISSSNAADLYEEPEDAYANAKENFDDRFSDDTPEDWPNQNVKYEKVKKGKVQWRIYGDYIAAVGYFNFFLMFTAYVGNTLFGIGLNVWLSEWSQNSKTNDSMAVEMRLSVYASLGVGQGSFVFISVLIGTQFLVGASAKLHRRLLHNLMRFPMSFYDVTPLGAIISRVGRDVEIMDNTLPMLVRMFIMQSLNVISSIGVIIFGTPIVGTVVIPLAVLYYFLQKFYVCTSRQLRRLESASRSPIYGHFGESLAGVSSIRAYGVEKKFIDKSYFTINEHMRATYAGAALNAWMAITLQSIGNILVLFACLFAMVIRVNSDDAGLVRLSVTYAMAITMTMMASVFSSSRLETIIVAAERIKEYIELPTEAPWVTEIRPPEDWPSNGAIKFEKLELRYREGQDLILQGLDCHIGEMEKVGVVGRTGAGKSSMTLALFRIVEPAGGKIIIDGIDISKIGLHDLRSRIAIIPQDPTLFLGTLRSNLDPFDEYPDAELWVALEKAHLKPFVSSLADNLQFQIMDGGYNLSIGQRQLLCLARALLCHCRILVLDEATAAIDLETERLILDTIRSSFAHCTIITIAHRLNTIANSDKVLVMSQGRALEYDKPEVLLSNPDSIYFSMAKEAGLNESLTPAP